MQSDLVAMHNAANRHGSFQAVCPRESLSLSSCKKKVQCVGARMCVKSNPIICVCCRGLVASKHFFRSILPDSDMFFLLARCPYLSMG